MNNKTAVVVLVGLCVLLGLGLLMRHNTAVETKKKDDGTIAELEGTVKKTTGELTTQKQVNEALTKTNETITTNLAAKTDEARRLAARVETTTTELNQTKTALTKAEAALNTEMAKAKADAEAAATRYAALDASKKQELAKRDASIKDLQDTRDQLNAKIEGLNADIAKLNATIGTLNTRITFVEGELKTAKDDKGFLTKELQRMQGERTEMERKMNDLTFLREQISTIKSDQAVARRVDWMRRGIFMDERKPATLLKDNLQPLTSAKPTKTKGSQLNVEVHRDGTVTIKAPAAAPKPAESGVDKSVTVSPEPPGNPAPKKK
ncbi:MAG: hypothetical protein FJ392_04065 [Verrucomicrobia bacterium]|nr:hypothetical protein [Verrucomicrobiota bacterium]